LSLQVFEYIQKNRKELKAHGPISVRGPAAKCHMARLHRTGSVRPTATSGRTGWWAEGYARPARNRERSRRALGAQATAGTAAVQHGRQDGNGSLATEARAVASAMSDHEPDGNDLLGGRREGVCGGSSARRTREASGGSPAWWQLGWVALWLDARRPGDDGVGALRQDGGSEWRC
jgi:hypothetical protein